MGRHSSFAGNRLPNRTWEINNRINPATKKRAEAITKGCAEDKPNLVAVEAEDHKIENTNPAISNFQW